MFTENSKDSSKKKNERVQKILDQILYKKSFENKYAHLHCDLFSFLHKHLVTAIAPYANKHSHTYQQRNFCDSYINWQKRVVHCLAISALL